MAIPSLLGSYIDETYQRIVQTDNTRTEFADGLGNSIPFLTNNTSTGSYGSFYDTGSYAAASATTVYSMSLSTTDISNGVYVSGSQNPYNTQIKVSNAGVYNLQFSAQFTNTDNNGQDVAIWIRKNGNDLPDTSGIATIAPFKAGQAGQGITSWNWFLNLAPNDYVQLCWHVEAADVISLDTLPVSSNPTHPRTPSLIVTANRVDAFLSNTGSFSGSFNGVFTGSLQGTASWATNAITSYTPISTTGSTIYSTSPSTGNVNPANGIFLGGGAGSAALKADYGVFLGYRAGYTATTASEAVFIGPAAGENASKADHSVFIGTGAGRNAINASYSTIIGAYAGWSPTSTGVGTNNIIIGNYVTLPDDTKNSINIGGIIFATGSYSSFGTVYSGSMMGKVGINKTTPLYNLDVSGSGNYTNGLTVTGSVTSTNGFTGSFTGSFSGAILQPTGTGQLVYGEGSEQPPSSPVHYTITGGGIYQIEGSDPSLFITPITPYVKFPNPAIDGTTITIVTSQIPSLFGPPPYIDLDPGPSQIKDATGASLISLPPNRIYNFYAVGGIWYGGYLT